MIVKLNYGMSPEEKLLAVHMGHTLHSTVHTHRKEAVVIQQDLNRIMSPP